MWQKSCGIACGRGGEGGCGRRCWAVGRKWEWACTYVCLGVWMQARVWMWVWRWVGCGYGYGCGHCEAVGMGMGVGKGTGMHMLGEDANGGAEWHGACACP